MGSRPGGACLSCFKSSDIVVAGGIMSEGEYHLKQSLSVQDEV